MLRYLPPVLKDSAWKQESGGSEVWFRLQPRTSGCSPAEKGVTACWELTVLNRLERTLFQFAPGAGITFVRSENLAKPADSYTKQRMQPQSGIVNPAPDVLRQKGETRPAGAFPQVTEVEPAQFEAATAAMLKQAGRPAVAIDLNGDGRMERIEGSIGQWHNQPLKLFDANGRELLHTFLEPAELWEQHRLEIVPVKGFSQAALLYQVGKPGTVHWTSLRWLEGEKLVIVRNWQPKTELLWGTYVKVESDGTVVLTNDPKEMGGYLRTRRYRIKTDSPVAPYVGELISDEVKAGPYPTAPDDLLTAAFAAKWHNLEADLARYIPDAGLRSEFLALKCDPSWYVHQKAEVGSLTYRKEPGWEKAVQEITPGAPDAKGVADFQVRVGQWEGYQYWIGKVTFGTAADGRLIISGLDVQENGFIY